MNIFINFEKNQKFFSNFFDFSRCSYIEGQKSPLSPFFLCTLITEYPNHRLHTTDLAATQGASAGASRLFWRHDAAWSAAERLTVRERWRGKHTSSEGSAIMIRTVAMLSRRRRYCQQCGTGSGSCFQQPGRWFGLYIREVVSNRVYHLIPDYGGHKFSTSDRHACGIKSANFQKRGVLYKQQRI